uniref:Uncharacterized protein n=1 Tax=Meloidogyne enterolobii TaxID=390850 RepID=A0A6V7W8G6_MELEN|nr:unnamed protein product [Meloidogyne enterolobii]
MLKISSNFIFIIFWNFSQLFLIKATGKNSPTKPSSPSVASSSYSGGTFLPRGVQTEKVGLQVLLELAEREEAENKRQFLDLLALELWKKGIRIVFGINENERGNKTKKTKYSFWKTNKFL